MHRWCGIRANAKTITPMALAAMFKSVVRVPDLVVPGRREPEMRPAPGEGDTVWTRWRFSDDPHTMSTAKDGVELQPCGSKHMKRGYYSLSLTHSRDTRGCEGQAGIIKLSCCCLSAQRGEIEWRKRRQTNIKPQRASFQTNMNWIFLITKRIRILYK